MIWPISISLFGLSKNECENLCRNRGERFPSIFDLTTQATDSDTTDVIWTDGVLITIMKYGLISREKQYLINSGKILRGLGKNHVLWAIIYDIN